MTRVAGIVLAAGASARMGRPKMLLPLAGRTVLAAVVAPLLEAGLDPTIVVLGHDADAIRRGAGLTADPRLRVVVNEAWAEGMASSLRRGLEECAAAAAAVVALGDQPGVSPGLVRRVVAAWRGDTRLVVPVHAGRAGHPVLFSRELWDELRALSGDVGGRAVVRRHWSEAAQVEGEPPTDLDTEDDYRALLEGRPARSDEGLELP